MDFWQKYSEKFLALSNREKWLLMLGGCTGLFFLLLTFLVEPAIQNNEAVRKRIQTESNQILAMKGEMQSLKNRLGQDPDKEIDKELRQLMEKSQELSSELAEQVDRLLSPGEMANLLQEVLVSSKGLKLVSLESQPAKPVLADADNKGVNYYIHPVRIELTGSYFQIKDYLKSLEGMTVKYFWSKFQYQVEEYPKARLVLEVYTLGTRLEFIGG
ncbi:type 4a pilus biogenesis protein PilO [Vibrio sp. HN007]|uniref:type 4a pilus biogenesis protein PilO n=1 Tax=Vibrio iocasae TaxID=3098914 RepID=UPI0035D47D36